MGMSGGLYAPTGIRTPVLGLKGLRPSPLDDGGAARILPYANFKGQRFDRRRAARPR